MRTKKNITTLCSVRRRELYLAENSSSGLARSMFVVCCSVAYTLWLQIVLSELYKEHWSTKTNGLIN